MAQSLEVCNGFVYLFDRGKGKPLFSVESRKYPPSTVPGEVAASEQPLPARPAPFARQLLTEDLLTMRTPEAHQWALEKFNQFRSEGQFIPFGVGKDTVIFPGFDGGGEWGGPGGCSAKCWANGSTSLRERLRWDTKPIP